ncbi:class C sortase [Bifidobacterium pseudolongum]|uniref:Sortase n=2 Tax=Bifidobacterium pseudolongum TaxID=1694 RepID=A0A223AB47_9BIFI|nr:class C sortase [Bifidobacterium pseudolongum]ASS31173.1 sortase [Bifidobacterium pseudolongum]ASS31179.1 sortase [Bifidobacterium pseudolongum]PKU93193.1 sortase [Bifidobacterium pseudolongum subsp. globosum]PKU98834.1 sortase [Bifidobacterium pseudolongum subsp. globosum]
MCRHGDRQASKRWRSLVAGCLLLVVSATCATIPFALQHANQGGLAAVNAGHANAAAIMDTKTRERELADAARYNQRLAGSGQPVLGDNPDPFNNDQPTYDAEYLHELDLPADGIMATVAYPRLGIELPVRHGTSAGTLEQGAGHVYGTSLPVGGENTHTVISAHTGLADTLMFDKLHSLGGQAQVGDVFYLNTLNQTLAYKVTSIRVVNPDEFDQLKIQPGQDLATLLTCTPYGVNTKRLLVTGTRAHMPDQAPLPQHAPEDHTWLWVWIPIAVFWILIIIIITVSLTRSKARPCRRRRPKHEPKADTQEFRVITPTSQES